jgi:thiamine-phosphate pyrophosphorylase
MTDRLRRRLDSSFLYLVTPALPANRDLDNLLAGVLDAGVDMVQLRDKRPEAGLLMPYCEIVRRRTEEFRALFIVNDRVDLAIAAGADGVHLGQQDLPVTSARTLLGGGPLIGLSTHMPAEILGVPDCVDYIGVGPVYETPTKPGRPAVGLDLVEVASRHAGCPFFAIGGVSEANLPQIMAAGARRVSVMRAITDARDPAQVARRLKSVLAGTSAGAADAGEDEP